LEDELVDALIMRYHLAIVPLEASRRKDRSASVAGNEITPSGTLEKDEGDNTLPTIESPGSSRAWFQTDNAYGFSVEAPVLLVSRKPLSDVAGDTS